MCLLLLVVIHLFTVESVAERESCVTPRNERGFCIIINSCDVLYQLLVQQRPVSQQNVDYLRESLCRLGVRHPMVCCPAEKSIQSERESCVTPRNERGSCISIKSCDVLYELVQQRPVGQQNADYLRESQCGFDGNIPKVCCPAEKSIQSENCTTPNNEKAECISLYSCPVLTKALATHEDALIEFVRKSNCGGTVLEPMVCCGSLSNFSKPNSVVGSSNDVKNELLPDRRYCGYQHSDDYISTKNDTGISEFPWLAALIFETLNNKNITECSGSLISNKYVLTAANCVLARYNWAVLTAVRLGEYNVKNQTDCVEERSDWQECSEPPQDFAIAKLIIHPQFDSTALNRLNNIALIRLKRAVGYSDYIRPICLPTPETKSAEVGDILTSSGWGLTEANIKKRILGRVISNEECVANTTDNHVVLTENQFCTIYLSSKTKISCIEDSGGPVSISHRNQWQQEGIISVDLNVCHLKSPVVHTKISRYLDWIKENIEP